MKINHLFSLLLNFTTAFCFGQLDIKMPLVVNYNPEIIKASGIHSVIINAELSEEAKNEPLPTSGKIAEGEFDDQGNMIYYLRSSNKLSPFFFHEKLCVINYFNYDEAGRKTLVYSEDTEDLEETQYQFDESGNITEVIISINGEKKEHRKFHWSEGKMMQTNSLVPTDAKTQFDEQGRITLSESNGIKTTTSYSTSGDTLIAIIKMYRANKIWNYTETKILISSNRLIYSKNEQPSLPLSNCRYARYDEQGNAVEYTYSFETDEPQLSRGPVTTEIVNSYNAEGLLIKRIFYDIEDGERVLSKTETFIYEKTPLKVKRPKGYLEDIRRETQEREHEFDSYDSKE